jgi:hypothetical protein
MLRPGRITRTRSTLAWSSLLATEPDERLAAFLAQTVHDSALRIDAFQSATDYLFADTASSPSRGEKGRPPFALDRERRLHDLASAGFSNSEVDV